MQHRKNWTFITDKSEGFHFRWKYYASNIDWNEYQQNNSVPTTKLKMINLFEKYNLIGNKRNFFIHMLLYCNKQNLNVFDYVPLTIILDKKKEIFKTNLTSLSKVIDILNDKYNCEKNKVDSNGLLLTHLNTKIKYTDLFIIEGLKKKMEMINTRTPDKESNTINDNINIFMNKSYISNKNYFIVKPMNLYQALGIKVASSINEITEHAHYLYKGFEKLTSEMEEYIKQHPDKDVKLKYYKTSSIIIQKYLDHPLLYYGRKFDVRIFVLIDYKLNVYLCKEGHMKACSEPYSIDTLDSYIHLTNYSLQKHSENFSKYEYANEISYEQFKVNLKDNYCNGDAELANSKFKSIIQGIKNLVEVSMNCVGNKLNCKKNTLSFQIFGYDFIIDRNFKPWILEINYNPGLQISSKVIENIVPRMVDDAFRMNIDEVFETVYSDECVDKETGKYKSPYHVDGYADDEYIYEFVCNINKNPYE